MRYLTLLCCSVTFIVLSLTGCGDDSGSPRSDAGTEGGSAEPDEEPTPCTADVDCDDGRFCNGEESCVDGLCENGEPVVCDDGIACTDDVCEESLRRCRSLAPDLDRDGHFAASCLDEDGVPLGDDCDDQDSLRFPGNIEVCDDDHHDEDCDPETNGDRDLDGDGFYDDQCCNPESDEEGAPLRCGDDCDDLKISVNMMATEACDLFDNDCDGKTDEGVSVMLFPDEDYDLHGAKGGTPEALCPGQQGWVDNETDCDDADPERYEGLPEFCDEKDNDCDTTVDEDPTPVDWYADADGDGFGDALVQPEQSCEPIEGRVINKRDCNDDNPGIHPAAGEACDGVDTDCNGASDFQLGVNDFEDDDGDGVADVGCPGGMDCKDRDPDTAAGNDELCDGRDNDCDGSIDEDTVSTVWYLDRDKDGYGDHTASAEAFCGTIPGRVASGGDCDDTDATIHPHAIEHCDGINEDCDFQTDESPAHAECSLANATALCVVGNCRIDVCDEGFANCDGDIANGCETSANFCGGGAAATGAAGSGVPDAGAGAGGFVCPGTQHDGNVVIASPADITALSGIACITGDVDVIGTTLTSLGGLESLVWIGGHLDVQNDGALTSLSGLNALDTVAGYVRIESNNQLSSVAGLESLTTVGGYLQIYANIGLLDLDGLSGLERVDGYFYLYDNDQMTDVDGVANLRDVGTYVTVDNNDALTNLSGLSGLQTIGTNMRILNNPSLANLDGFGGLSSIGGTVEVRSNAALTSVGGFANLGQSGGSIIIRSNQALATIGGFAAVDTISADLDVHDNGLLVGVTGFGSLTTILGGVSIYDNAVLGSIDGLIGLTTLGGDMFLSNDPMLSICAGAAISAALTGWSGTLTNTGNLDCAGGLGNCTGTSC